jgi:hypothetical protein
MPEMVVLLQSFPTLRHVLNEWDAPRLDDWASSPAPSSGGRHAARFCLGVYNNRVQWRCGAFDFFAAYDTWDAEHRAAFLAWAQAPRWP